MAKKTTSNTPKASKPERALPSLDDVLDGEPLTLTINGVPCAAMPKEFSSGSYGDFFNGKVPHRIGDATVTLQISFNAPIVGTKPKD